MYDTLSVTGFTEILDVRRQLRKVDIQGCPVIGKGAIGVIYRIDDDTVVKVYQIPDCLPMIEKEQKRAKQAFVRGIPTAISYDVVQVGDKYGSVFEMVKAENFNDLIAKKKADKAEILRMYVALLKTVHKVEMEPGELPDARDIYREYLRGLQAILPENMIQRITALLAAMPEDVHAVHGDIQMKNVMLSETEPLLIDMETLCVGNAVFDFAGLWVAYCAFNEDEPANAQEFFGIDQKTCDEIYQSVLSLYLEDRGKNALRQAEDRIQVLGAVRFLYLVASLGLGNPELKETRIRHTLERLQRLLDRVEGLCL